MKQVYILLAAVIGLTVTACTPILRPLVHKDRVENDWSSNELKKVQFYLSHDVTINRKLKKESTEITSGKIKVVNGEKVEEVIIPEGTPGILTYSPTDDRIGISFEEGEGRYLMFGPNMEKGGKYYLMASQWKNGIGKVTYEGREWYTNPESGEAFLLVNLNKLNELVVSQRKAKGRTLEEY